MPQPKTMIDAEIIVRGVPQDLIIAGESLKSILEEVGDMSLYKHIVPGDFQLRIVNFWRDGVQLVKDGICTGAVSHAYALLP